MCMRESRPKPKKSDRILKYIPSVKIKVKSEISSRIHSENDFELYWNFWNDLKMTISQVSKVSAYINNFLLPTLVVTTLPVAFPLLTAAFYGKNFTKWSEIILGNTTSWMLTITFMLWAFLSLKIPSKQHIGLPTQYGYRPHYQNNGWLYYITTNAAFFVASYTIPSIPKLIFNNIHCITATSSAIGFILSIFLLCKGKFSPSQTAEKKLEKIPVILQMYDGIELHPTILGVDVKHLTNCRMGMMSWQLLVNAFLLYSYQKNGFNLGITANFILQTVYLAKFFWIETAYFITYEIVFVKAGFYSIWGCISFLPIFYTSPSHYFVTNPPELHSIFVCLLSTLALVSIFMTYLVDRDREVFKLSDGKKTLWDKKPKVIEAEYTVQGKKQHSRLLISGVWGVSRHLNYLFEITTFLCLSLFGYNLGIWPFLCPIFVTFILFHRSFRDDERCRNKYGKAWTRYCKIVKYRMIPYVF